MRTAAAVESESKDEDETKWENAKETGEASFQEPCRR
jgi:hypothetical protein